MAIYTTNLDERLRVEGKDATNRFQAQRLKFIEDTCTEISSSQDYHWLEETTNLTVPATITDWINLPDNFQKVLSVYYSGQPLEYVSERDYAADRYKVTTYAVFGYYRIRFNNVTAKFQIALVNGPAAASSVQLLYKKWLDKPEKFPDFMEEVILRGALSRFLAFQEGDDLEVAIDSRNEYIRLAQQQDKLGNNSLVDKPRRTKTNRELMQAEMMNRYGR